jgi:sporulation protein YlmC with PRC-barrel domain
LEKKYLSKDKLVGKQVIDSEAMIVGSVKDMAFDFDAKEIGLTITARNGGEIVVPGSNIGSVGDVIILNKKIEVSSAAPIQAPTMPPQATYTPAPPPIRETTVATSTGLCKVCGFQNDANAKFCIKCGSRLS